MIAIFVLLIISSTTILHAGDADSIDHITYDLQRPNWQPMHPFVMFVTMQTGNQQPEMYNKLYIDEKHLLVLQGHSCTKKQLSQLLTLLKKKLNEEGSLTNERTFQSLTMLPHKRESTYALTWINTRSEGLMKNYTHPGEHKSRPFTCKEDLVFHLLSAHEPMDTHDDILEKIAEFRRENPQRTLYEIALCATENLGNITKPTSYIIVDLRQFRLAATKDTSESEDTTDCCLLS